MSRKAYFFSKKNHIFNKTISLCFSIHSAFLILPAQKIEKSTPLRYITHIHTAKKIVEEKSDFMEQLSGQSKRQALEKWLRDQLRTGNYAPHCRFFSHTKIRKLHGVSQATVTEALQALEREGLIYFKPGCGTFVAPPLRAKKILVVSHLDRTNDEYNTFLCSAEQASGAASFIIVPISTTEFLSNIKYLKVIYPQVAAIIFFRLPDLFIEYRKPLEQMDVLPFFYGSTTYRNSTGGRNCFYYDEKAVVHTALEVLYRAGHRAIGCVNLQYGVFSFRYQLYQEWMNQRQLPILPGSCFGVTALPELYQMLLQTPKEKISFTALFCPFHLAAVEALQGLQQIGLRIPEDVAIIGVGDVETEFFSVIHPHLTSVCIDHRDDAAILINRIAAAAGQAVPRIDISSSSRITIQYHDSV